MNLYIQHIFCETCIFCTIYNKYEVKIKSLLSAVISILRDKFVDCGNLFTNKNYKLFIIL